MGDLFQLAPLPDFEENPNTKGSNGCIKEDTCGSCVGEPGGLIIYASG